MQPDESVVSRALWARGPKRVSDLLVSVSLLVFLSPLLLATALLVKLTSRGPVFFSQVRSGRCGAEFRILKFRTMRGGRIPDAKEIVPLDHPEITAVGRLLRRTKIDELPQLLAVVAGTMSLIGPRPTLPDQVARYDAFERRRLLLRPGCTGLAQVNGNTAIEWDQRIRYDVYYVKHCSLWLDIRILVRTVMVIVAGDSRFARRFDDSPCATSSDDTGAA